MSENKGYQIWLPILFSLFTVAGMLIGYNLQAPSTVINIDGTEDTLSESGITGAGRVEEVLRYVESRYVDENPEVLHIVVKINKVCQWGAKSL